MTTSILLIRHGETAWNAVRRLQGHIDIPLNLEGQRQAEALASALASEPLHAIIASDLQRALQTAQAVAGQQRGAGAQRKVQQDVQLRERCYGVFEGMLYADIERTYPAEFAAWQARDIDAVMPSGERVAESFRQFFQRCMDGIAAWGERHPGQTIAIVAHGGVLECAYRAATGMTLDSPRDFQVKNASINRFTFDNGRLALQSWGESAHLEPLVLDDII
ncbi:phosphoglycerate mutase [Massilia sp. Root351]|jgi:probable phosphoglycerate mutase|uniref:histidine phosphatase family protein n=1 Tax=Massilia sp. Root351 TaxID=1736522 RepID=UPI00070A4CC1|nr:histidine phosphatase family protein [Massilia sp. Root351]KQV88601.1 phosphoglycerate mutase [Massilia sp. Root351]